jgi:hypothetical protein
LGHAVGVAVGDHDAGGLHQRTALAAEVAALEADPDDRREMLEVAALMENMSAAG